MKTEKEIKEHIMYLMKTANHGDQNQLRDVLIKVGELNWVLGNYNKDR